jgi:UDP-N-acetylglucosamine acyltransferase
MLIDPRAIIDPSAEIADDVKIGPWSIVGPNVTIGSGCDIRSHVIIKGPTVIGQNNTIYQFSSVGEDTPDMKYGGEPTKLTVGDNNIIREGVTIHRGTLQDRGETIIGDSNLIMAYAHIGHDSVVGNHCVLVNNASLAGHVHIGDWAILGGYTLVHQFCHIGSHAFTGFGSVIGKDIPAYVMAAGFPAAAKSINTEGLKRRDFDKEEIATINKAFKLIYRRNLTKDEALTELRKLLVDCDKIQALIDSLENSSLGITR